MTWRLCEACGTAAPDTEWINPHEWEIAGKILDGATCPSCHSTRYVDTGVIPLTEKEGATCDAEPIT